MFIEQSGTFPKDFAASNDEQHGNHLEAQREEILSQALTIECGVPLTAETKKFWSVLGGLGCHDISAMREAIGMPLSIAGVSFDFPFWKWAQLNISLDLDEQANYSKCVIQIFRFLRQLREWPYTSDGIRRPYRTLQHQQNC